MNKSGIFGGSLALLAACIASSASAHTLDLSGIWKGSAACSVGPVEFTINIRGTDGTLTYHGYGPEKLYATQFPVKAIYDLEQGHVRFEGPGPQGDNFQVLQGHLYADGTLGRISGLQVGPATGGTDRYCENTKLVRAQPKTKPGPSLNTKGLTNENLLTNLLEGRFAVIDVPVDHIAFGGMFGSYLSAYARKCAADPKTRPKDFVEMTNLECVGGQAVTATRYLDGSWTESAPYCLKWGHVPNGRYADPDMWATKKKLDAVLHNDTYNIVFAAAKASRRNMVDSAFEVSPQRLLAGILVMSRDMNSLLEMNACDSKGLARFQENLKLYAINRPFGIRPDGSPTAPIPIPAPGTAFVDPNYEALLEDLIKAAAPSWQVNKYVLKSIANIMVKSRDEQGRPTAITANYSFDGLPGRQLGSMTLSFFEGYPECLFFSDKPSSCRTPDKGVTARYVHGSYSLKNLPIPAPEEKQTPTDKSKENDEARARREERARTRHELRNQLRN